ncbi:extracellular solute-binding protein [Paenibacillus sp. GYB004]|uniref:ABC transporter substrate-binding protein n=1 Tax=Paenibacillus sp. GYB004 TaxID=2994393 RepID=UPI002F961265
MKKRLTALIGAGLSIVLLAGCGNNGGKPISGKEDAYNNEPVTLTFYSHYAGILSQSDLDVLAQPVIAKFPNIKMEYISGTTLENMIGAQDLPDIILTSNYYLHDLLQKKIAVDLAETIRTQKVDMGPLEPEAVNLLKQFGKNGEIYGIPYAMNYGVMVYNKDIFDKLALPYPKDNMTWNETIELARKATRLDQGTQYIGMDLGDPASLTRAYSLPVVDEKQEKTVFTNDAYGKVFRLYDQLYQIPGIVDGNKKYTYGVDYFLKDQKMAMFPYWIAALTTRLQSMKETGKTINWDVVSYPSLDDKPGIGREIDFHLGVVTPTSDNKKAAFAVLQTMMGEEAQKTMNSGTRLTILKDLNLKKQFASSTKLYEDKNLAGVYSVKPAALPEATKFDTKMYSFLKEAVKAMVTENKDVNTVLREAEEKGNKYILEEGNR